MLRFILKIDDYSLVQCRCGMMPIGIVNVIANIYDDNHWWGGGQGTYRNL